MTTVAYLADNGKPVDTRWTILVCGVVLALGAWPGSVSGQDFRIRHVQIDPREAEAQLARQPQWVRVPREEFDKVLQAVKLSQSQAKRASVIVQAHYQARWDDAGLVGEGSWIVWNGETDKAVFSVPTFGLALQPPVRWNGWPAVMGTGPAGELIFIPTSTDGPGKTGQPQPVGLAGQRIEFHWSARWERRSGELLANLELPASQLATFELEVPIRFRASLRGAEVSLANASPHPQKRGWVRYLWALGPASTRLEVSLQPAVPRDSTPIVHVQQQVTHVFDSARWQSRFQVELETSDEALPALSFQLPAGLQVESVQERLHGLPGDYWEEQRTPQGTVLRMRLPGSIRRAELEIVCRAKPLVWDTPTPLSWLEVEPASSMLVNMSIRWRQELTLSGWWFGDFQPQQPPQLDRDGFVQLVLEQTVPGVLGPTNPPRVTVRRQTADVSVQADFSCQLGLSRSQLLAQLTWNVRSGSVFRLGVRLPADWLVEDAQVQSGEDASEWTWRRDGQQLWAERQQGALQAPATARMTLRLRAASQQPDFTRSSDWPLPEVVPEQVSWARANWYFTVERVRDTRGRRYPIGVLWPGTRWSLRPTAPASNEPGRANPDYVFTGPLPSNSQMRIAPVPGIYRLNLDTQLDWHAAEPVRASTAGRGRLHVRWLAQVEPLGGLVRTVVLRFPGEMPELDWRVVAGDARLQKVVRTVEREPIASGDLSWTVFQFTFQTPLLSATRLESDWLYPCPGTRQSAESPHPRPLCSLSLPCGQENDWWEGRLVATQAVPPDWEFAAQPIANDPKRGEPFSLHTLPWAYAKPAILHIRESLPAAQPAVIEGALLGMTWNGEGDLQCDYWAWTRVPANSAEVASQLPQAFRLQLPHAATLKSAETWRVVEGKPVHVSDGSADWESNQVVFQASSTGSVIFHVRYSMPVRRWFGLANWPQALPSWQGNVTVLGQRVWLRLPEVWSPISRRGVIRWDGGPVLFGNAGTLPQNHPAQVVAAWWQHSFSDVASPAATANLSPTMTADGLSSGFSLSSTGFASWELSESAWSGGTVWLDRERAGALAGALAVLVFLVGYALQRWSPRWHAVLGIAVGLASLLALIWLPSDLACLAYWPVASVALLTLLAIRSSAAKQQQLPVEQASSAWFSTPQGTVMCWWLAVVAGLLSLGSWLVLAEEVSEANAKPANAREATGVSTVTVFHYSEGQGESSRHWVLVPLDWWQRWQQQIQPRPAMRDWLVTSSHWLLEVSDAGFASQPALARFTAKVTWELEVMVVGQAAQVSLAVGGIRWQSASETTSQGTVPLDITPSEPGLMVRLSGTGTHRLRLAGLAEVQQSGSEYRVRWKSPPWPFAQLLAQLPGNVRQVECVGARGRVHLRTSGESPSTPSLPLQCQAELGPASEVGLTWLVPVTIPAEWIAEEFHWLRPEKSELRWHTLCRFDVSRGQLTAVRLAVPDAFVVRSVEARSAQGAPLTVLGWHTAGQSPYRTLTVELAQPASGTWTLHVEYAIDLTLASVWAAGQKAEAALNVAAPAWLRPAPLSAWNLAMLERYSLQKKTLMLSAPYLLPMDSSRSRGAWFTWQSEERLAVQIEPRAGAKPWLPSVEFLKRWPNTVVPPVDPNAKTPRAEIASFFQLLGPTARLQVELSGRPSERTVARNLHLQLDWYQAQALFRIELQAQNGPLPVAVTATVPAALRITEVSGAALAEWQQEGNRLRLWFRPGQSSAALQISGTVLLTGTAERRTLTLPVIQFPGFRATASRLEVSATAGLRFQLVKSQGLTQLSQSDNKASYQSPSGMFSGVLELNPLATRYTAQLTSTLRREPEWFWETQVDCRTTAGTIRSVSVRVHPWTGPPPRVISEEFQQAQIRPAPDGHGYDVRVDFPEAASLADQNVRFRILGKLTTDGNPPARLPILELPEAQSVRHRLIAWPRGAVIENATAEGDAWRLPTEPNATPVGLRWTAGQSRAVQLLFAQVDTWRTPSTQSVVQFTAWLVHGPRAWLTMRLPASSTLCQAVINERPVLWYPNGDGTFRLTMLDSTGISCVRLIYLVDSSSGDRPLPDLDSQPLHNFWLQRWQLSHTGTLAQDEAAQAVRIGQLALAEAALAYLRQELPFVTADTAAPLSHIAGFISEALQVPEREMPDLDKRREGLQRQWSELTASPRFEPIRRLGNVPGNARSSLGARPPAPFLAAWPSARLWSISDPWPEDGPTPGWWAENAGAVLATLILACGLLAWGIAWLVPGGRHWLGRLAPEGLLVLAGFWAIFLEPRWAALIWAGLGLYWRYRRWRGPRALLPSNDFALDLPQ